MKKELAIQKLRQKIAEMYPENNSINRNMGRRYYTEYENIQNSRFSNHKQTVGLVIYRNKNFYILLLIICLFLPYIFPLLVTEEKYENMVSIVCIICLLSIIYCVYAILQPKKVFLKTTEENFILDEKQEFRWNEILTTGILTIPERPINSRFLVLGMASGEIIEINPEFTGINADEFIKMIHLNKHME